MIALDTNVLVRFLVAGDDPAQAAQANAVFESGSVLVLGSVLLETAWVLRKSFGFDRRQIAMAFRLLSRLANVRVENLALVTRALGWVENGVDIADAMHLAALPAGAEFVTFDRALVRRAAKLDGAPTTRLA
jgi:predicted nucleic-acid-binding protein